MTNQSQHRVWVSGCSPFTKEDIRNENALPRSTLASGGSSQSIELRRDGQNMTSLPRESDQPTDTDTDTHQVRKVSKESSTPSSAIDGLLVSTPSLGGTAVGPSLSRVAQSSVTAYVANTDALLFNTYWCCRNCQLVTKHILSPSWLAHGPRNSSYRETGAKLSLLPGWLPIHICAAHVRDRI